MIYREFFESFDPQLVLKNEMPVSDMSEASLQRQILKQQNQIAVALAYLHAGQPHLATMVLEGMEA